MILSENIQFNSKTLELVHIRIQKSSDNHGINQYLKQLLIPQ